MAKPSRAGPEEAMIEMLADTLRDLTVAAQGPIPFRVLMQAVVAVAFAGRDGVRDARGGFPIADGRRLGDASSRGINGRGGRASLGEVLVALLVIDIASQTLVLGFEGGGQSVAVVMALSTPLYLLLRGLLARAAAPRPIHRIRRRPSDR